MHRHKKYHCGPSFSRPHRGKRFIGLFWLIGLAILFSSGRWWPGILVLVGLAILFGSLFREEQPSEMPSQSPPPFTTPPAAVAPVAPPAEPIHRADLLPTHCPNCGGPVQSNEIKWTGPQSAACSYCGSNLPMKK
jgi:hypothetical protein